MIYHLMTGVNWLGVATVIVDPVVARGIVIHYFRGILHIAIIHRRLGLNLLKGVARGFVKSLEKCQRKITSRDVKQLTSEFKAHPLLTFATFLSYFQRVNQVRPWYPSHFLSNHHSADPR